MNDNTKRREGGTSRANSKKKTQEVVSKSVEDKLGTLLEKDSCLPDYVNGLISQAVATELNKSLSSITVKCAEETEAVVQSIRNASANWIFAFESDIKKIGQTQKNQLETASQNLVTQLQTLGDNQKSELETARQNLQSELQAFRENLTKEVLEEIKRQVIEQIKKQVVSEATDSVAKAGKKRLKWWTASLFSFLTAFGAITIYGLRDTTKSAAVAALTEDSTLRNEIRSAFALESEKVKERVEQEAGKIMTSATEKLGKGDEILKNLQKVMNAAEEETSVRNALLKQSLNDVQALLKVIEQRYIDEK